MRPVAVAVLQRLKYQIAFNIGDGSSNKGARDLFGRHGGVGNGA